MRVGTTPEGVFDRLALTLAPGLVPTPLFESYVAMMMSRAIMAGTSLGVFRALDERPDDAAGLGQRRDLEPLGADVLVIALHAIGYVKQSDGRYHNSRHVERFLLPDRKQSQESWVG